MNAKYSVRTWRGGPRAWDGPQRVIMATLCYSALCGFCDSRSKFGYSNSKFLHSQRKNNFLNSPHSITVSQSFAQYPKIQRSDHHKCRNSMLGRLALGIFYLKLLTEERGERSLVSFLPLNVIGFYKKTILFVLSLCSSVVQGVCFAYRVCLKLSKLWYYFRAQCCLSLTGLKL